MSTLRFVPCEMDGCRCGLTHPAYTDCDLCRGHGHALGGDEMQPCPNCRLRLRHTYGPFLVALDELAVDEEQRAREAAEDRVDVTAQEASWD